MKYYYEKKSTLSFEETRDRVTILLKEEGFGILSTIPIHEKLKEKLDVDYPRYLILGACNPPNAYKALQAEPYIGTMLPCNVVIREDEAGQITAAAVLPTASMAAVENPELKETTAEIEKKLCAALDRL